MPGRPRFRCLLGATGRRRSGCAAAPTICRACAMIDGCSPSGPCCRNVRGVDVGSDSHKGRARGTGECVLHVARGHRDPRRARRRRLPPPGRVARRGKRCDAECVAAADGPAASPRRSASPACGGRRPIDRRNLPVGDILAWVRPAPERQAAWLERQIGAPALFARTGLRPEPKYTLPKLLWLREHKAADFTRLRHGPESRNLSRST